MVNKSYLDGCENFFHFFLCEQTCISLQALSLHPLLFPNERKIRKGMIAVALMMEMIILLLPI